MGKLGIDFGTSYSTLCVYDEKRKEIIPLKEVAGGNKIPSVAYYLPEGRFVYGTAAVGRNPESEGFEDYDDDDAVREVIRQIHLRTIVGVKRNIAKGAVIALPGKDGVREVAVADIVTGFFKYFKKIAEDQYFKPANESLTQVCVTHPVDFSPEQVAVLKSCAEAAGLPDIIMVEEPVAAALAFSDQFAARGCGKNILVYDLGGGTFDLAYVHEEREGDWKVPFKSGNKNCGGNDFDSLIYDEIEKRIRIALKDESYYISGDKNTKDVGVLNECRNLKEQLSVPGKEMAFITTESDAVADAGKQFRRLKLSRTELEGILGDKIQETIHMVDEMTKSLHQEGYVIGALALIGGSSVIPMIESRLKSKVSFPILRGFDADIAVARGAIVRLNTKVGHVVQQEKKIVVAPPPVIEKKRKPKGVCKNCRGYYYDGQSFCHTCGHMLEEIPGLSDPGGIRLVQERLRRILEFDQKFEVDRGYYWDATVGKFAERIDRLRVILQNPELGFADQLPDHLIGRMDLLLEKCRHSEFHIALIGTIKAGKSTLINAMLGGHYASVSETSETAVLTKFRAAGSDECAQDRLEITYYTKKEWKAIWDALNVAKKSSDEAVKNFRRSYQELNADAIKDDYLDKSVNCLAYESDSALRADLRKFTSAKSPEHYFIKEVTVYLRKLDLPPQVVFVDTPGLNDVFEYRSKITKSYIGRANAVMVCVDARALTKDIHDLILQVFDNAGHDVSKVYIIATHRDDLNQPHEGWQRIFDQWKNILMSEHAYGADAGHCNMLVRENVIPVSAYKILQLIDSKCSESELKKLEHFAEDFLNYKPGDGHDVLVKKIEEFARIKLLKDRIRDHVILRFESILKEDIRENFGFCANEVRDFMRNLVAGQSEVIGTAKQGASKINEHIKELQQKIEDLGKQKEKLRQVKKSCADAIETAMSSLRRHSTNGKEA